MANGQRTFEGKPHLSIGASILQKDPPPVTTIQPASSPALDYIIRTCLAKDPDERFQTAHDVKLQLSWLLQSGGVVSRPPATEAWAWRHRVSIALAGAAMLALLLVLLVTTFRTR